MKYSRIHILSGLSNLYPFLENGTIVNDIYKYSNKIFVKHNVYVDGHSIRIWQSNSVLDVWYDMQTSKNFIAAIDYTIEKDRVKIEYLNLNDEEMAQHNFESPPFFDDISAKNTVKSMIKYVENVARENGKSEIVIDVHRNLRIYDKFYKECGFVATDTMCKDNPFWRETVKHIDIEQDSNKL